MPGMRRAVLAAALLLPACVTSPDPVPDPSEHGDCGIPSLHVGDGDVELSLTRTSSCPYYVDDVRTYYLQASGGQLIGPGAPVQIDAQSIGEGYEELDAQLDLTDEWGVGDTYPTEHALGQLHLDLVLAGDGSISGTGAGTVRYQDTPCTIEYTVAGTFAPEWQ